MKRFTRSQKSIKGPHAAHGLLVCHASFKLKRKPVSAISLRENFILFTSVHADSFFFTHAAGVYQLYFLKMTL
jgi:hypothetical protein